MSGTFAKLTIAGADTSTMLLLTDGTVLGQQREGRDWYLLRPDENGQYEFSTWEYLNSMTHARLYYASAVLADGRVMVMGGEYSTEGDDTNTGEIYDPNHPEQGWQEVVFMTDQARWKSIGDAPSCVLSDGTLLLGSIDDRRTVLFDPRTGAWIEGPDKEDESSEETWTLLRDGSVLTVECSNTPKAERYVPGQGGKLAYWTSAGQISDLVETSSKEIGPAILLPDTQGLVFVIGATGRTAFYALPGPGRPDTWMAGPSFPLAKDLPPVLGAARPDPQTRIGAKDAPACLLPNGRVLCAVGPVNGAKGDYLPPTYLFEMDWLTQPPTLSHVGGPIAETAPFQWRMLLLPSGKVLLSNGTADLYLYDPDTKAGAPSWGPEIIDPKSATVIQNGQPFVLKGKRLNGMSQAVCYGDDAQMATNYPLVCIKNRTTSHLRYCRTYDHSTMAIATGDTVVTTKVLPLDLELGASDLFVVANGIHSEPVAVTIV